MPPVISIDIHSFVRQNCFVNPHKAIAVKAKFNSFHQALRREFSGAVCAGAVLLIASTTQAQNLFVSAGNTIYEFAPGYMPGGASSIFATVPDSGAGLAFNSAGDLFVPSSNVGAITEIAPNGTQSTFASGLLTPSTVAFNSAGDLFVLDTGASAIYEYTPGGVRSTFATGVFAPYGLAFNSAGNLFAADGYSGNILQFSPSGVRSIFASVPGEGLHGFAFNSAGNLFVAAGGDAGYIFKFTPNGTQSTFASGLDFPTDLAFNSAGDLFVANFGSSPWIDKFAPNGTESPFDTTVGAIGLAFQGVTLPVPEPSALALLATIGVAALLARRS
jgi:sugar lactone lactonase YvrE